MGNLIRSISILVLLGLLQACSKNPDPTPLSAKKRILMVLAPENVYYTEFIIAHEALAALGYDIDIVSVKAQDVTFYMVPAAGTTVEETADNFPGNAKYNDFKLQFKDLFGNDWNQSHNIMPDKIVGLKSIFSINNLDDYVGIVIPGGTGVLNLRTDGDYEVQAGIASEDIELAAIKLNTLANQALKSGKPILAQCHGASLPVFWKIDGTETPLLLGQQAAGYPDPLTESTYATLGAILRSDDKVVVSSPNIALTNSRAGDSKIVTSRDWYPQTVAYATKVFVNIIETYPHFSHLQMQKKILLLHGGPIDASNCSPSNRANDIPCNYGTGINLPADFSHIKELMQSNHTDGYNLIVSDVDITSTSLPYTPGNQSSIENYLAGFDAVIFFKHWSTGVNSALQNALVSYVDNGGGILALHHALYNDVDDVSTGLNKHILTTQLFGATSEEQNWSAQRDNYQMYSTNYGHFISTYHLPTLLVQEVSFDGTDNPILNVANKSLSLYPVINIYDEVYINKRFVPDAVFGNHVNEITPLYSNNLSGTQAHTEGYVKLFNKNGDDKIGRVASFQAGESRASFSLDNPFSQVIRNAIIWITFK